MKTEEKINIVIGIIVAIGGIAFFLRKEMLASGYFDIIDLLINVVFGSLFVLSIALPIALPIAILLHQSNKKSKK